jgi:hypothetical protein
VTHHPATPRPRRQALAAIVASTLAIAIAYASAFSAGGAPPWSAWLFAAGTTGAVVATMALGAIRPGRGLGPLVLPFALMTTMLAAGFAALFVLPDAGAAEPLLLGLPRRAAILLYGIGLLPTLVLPIAYALTFAEQTLRPEDLARVVAAARASRGIPDDGHAAAEREGR